MKNRSCIREIYIITIFLYTPYLPLWNRSERYLGASRWEQVVVKFQTDPCFFRKGKTTVIWGGWMWIFGREFNDKQRRYANVNFTLKPKGLFHGFLSFFFLSSEVKAGRVDTGMAKHIAYLCQRRWFSQALTQRYALTNACWFFVNFAHQTALRTLIYQPI